MDPDQAFRAAVASALGKAGSSAGVFVVELPGLLEIAETFGEEARHLLLAKVEWRLQHLFGSSAVARTAATRFSLLAQGVLSQDVSGVVARIQRAVTGRQGGGDAGVVIVGTPTVGVALADLAAAPPGDRPACELFAANLIRRAGLALLAAQAERQGSYRIYCPAFEAAVRDSTLLRQALLLAIEGREFRLAYQPIVDLGTGRTVGLEALIRWPTPPAGVSASPARVIEAAEETGLIVPIGAQVLAQAAAQMRSWVSMGHPLPPVAVNVAGVTRGSP